MILYALVTRPGQLVSGAADIYYISLVRNEYVLSNHNLAQRSFATLAKLAHTLGGGISWDRWSSEAQRQLEHLGLKGSF